MWDSENLKFYYANEMVYIKQSNIIKKLNMVTFYTGLLEILHFSWNKK